MYFKNLKKVQKFVKAPAGFKLKNCRSLADAMQSCMQDVKPKILKEKC